MIRKWMHLAAAAVVLAAVAMTAGADDIGKQMTDPVSGKAVTVAKDTAFVTVNGTRLYFADSKNREAFLKAPESFLKATVECPVRNLKARANKANRVVVNDQIIYFCCANCPQAFAKEPNTYVSKLLDPVSGKEFDLASDSPKVTHKGTLYFFESEESKAAFEKEPAKYAKVSLP